MLPSTKVKTLYGFAANNIGSKAKENLSAKKTGKKQKDSPGGKPTTPGPGNDHGLMINR